MTASQRLDEERENSQTYAERGKRNGSPGVSKALRWQKQQEEEEDINERATFSPSRMVEEDTFNRDDRLNTGKYMLNPMR